MSYPQNGMQRNYLEGEDFAPAGAVELAEWHAVRASMMLHAAAHIRPTAGEPHLTQERIAISNCAVAAAQLATATAVLALVERLSGPVKS